MMFGLDYVLASHLVLASAGQDIKCHMNTAPKITVTAKGLDRGIDHTKTIRQLNTFKPLTGASPYKDDSQTYIQGLAKGGVSVSGEYQFETQIYPDLSLGCLYTNKIQINIVFDSTIFIAREYPKGSCHYNSVLAHELKHVAVDTELVNKYSNIIVKAVNNTMKTIGFAQGPYDEQTMPAKQEKVSKTLSGIILQYGNNFSIERDKAQSQIDTLVEYERVHALCKQWPSPVL